MAWCEPKLRESWTTVTGTQAGASAIARSAVPSEEPSSTSTSSKSYAACVLAELDHPLQHGRHVVVLVEGGDHHRDESPPASGRHGR